MKEFLQGRRFGFSLRPAFGMLAAGLGIATTLLDLMAWLQWGSRDTNGFVIAAYGTIIATTVVAALAALAALFEWLDVPEEERPLARLDLIAAAVAVVLYLVATVLRAGDLGGAGVTPIELLLAIAGLIVLLVDGVISASLYATREWEIIEEDLPSVRHRRRRTARS
ncbi:MAG: hypothetical protein HY071_00690 [Chloroflexi bacterium]|nr:hypothetical protein [Chloroflexota bacterium]